MDIGNLKNYENFKREAKEIFKSSLELFLSAKVLIYDYPFDQVPKYFNIDILENPQRGVYYLDDDRVLIIPKVYSQKTIVGRIGILFTKEKIGNCKKLFNVLEGAISKNLSNSFIFNFRSSIQYFDDNLIKDVVAKYFSKGYYNPSRIVYLIDYFLKLRTTSFEGSYFSTGMILTKSNYAFRGKHDDNRFGETHGLIKSRQLVGSPIDRRFWYLVDGKQSFYLCSRHLEITQLFNISPEIYDGNNYLNDSALSYSLKGGDVLFKVENEKELSLITADGTEFLYQENTWKYRNYSYIQALLYNKVEVNEEFYNSLIFYILNCSKSGNSTIIWIPKEIPKRIDILKSKNRLFRNDINIKEKRFSTTIMRFLSSDGCTIIDTDGFIRFYGCIVDMEKVKIKGVKGTGESAAGVLAENGISIKISQDGTIKLFTVPTKPPIII